jgi:hypothetical protein
MSHPFRKFVSRAELNRVLTTEIHKHEDLEDATLHAGPRLASPDANGCNWSSQFNLNVGSKGSPEYGRLIAIGIVEDARARCNISD